MSTDLLPVHPGEVLLEEFLRPMGISQYRLALGRSAYRRAASTRSLCRFFGLSEGFWLRMQASHDLKLAKQVLGGVLPSIEPFLPT
jgi:plasmid maintenance system antidote protein VapI